MTTWMTLTCLLATTSWLAVMCLLATGCEKPEPELDASRLAGRCLKGRVLTLSGCTSFTNVQVLDADVGSTTVYNGREYRNVVQINNLGQLDSLREGDEFHFVVGAQPERACQKHFSDPDSPVLCTANLAPIPLPNVTVRICIENLSKAPCR